MPRLVRNRATFVAGVLATAFFALYAWEATTYDIGTAASPGPGLFPRIISWGGLGVGLLLLVQSLLSSHGVEREFEEVLADEGREGKRSRLWGNHRLSDEGRRLVHLGSSFVGYVAAVYVLGFTAASIVAAWTIATLSGSPLSRGKTLVYAVVLVLGVEATFTLAFGASFPGGLVRIVQNYIR